jgi:pimeloyl-ACP methyl ester carboxylesterase
MTRAKRLSDATAVMDRPGARLVYEVTGEGPAVVLIHGFGLDMRMWDPQMEALAARFLVVRYDCRGFGSSGPLDPAVPYTHAGDLVALLDHLDIGDAVLAGLSFGGRVALQTALAAPGRVRGLALLDAVLDGVPWDPESARALDEVARRVQAGGVLAGREAWLAHPLFAAARERPDLAGALAAMVAGYPGQHWLGQDPHRQTRPPIEVLEGVAVPTLVAVGERDVPSFREMSAVLARRIPGAAYHVVADAGHMINIEQPAAVNALLTRFVRDALPATETVP